MVAQIDYTFILNSEIFSYVILPLLIFFARILDVSLGTIRIVLISKGLKYFAPIFGFFEVLVWILAIGQIIQHIDNILLYIAYAGGFAIGTFVGIKLENRLSLGLVVLRVITRKDASELIGLFKHQHHGFTVVEAEGPSGPVHIIFSVVNRRDLKEVIADIKKFNPHAFYTIEDARFASIGIFASKSSLQKRLSPFSIKSIRKGK
ncbi:MAG: DUF2179 domain-containing protein [Candidatus Bathyarchaeota archaeon]|nr:DUF2179 domain-containing protein [Candidatus Bathyarchaeota archaeon]